MKPGLGGSHRGILLFLAFSAYSALGCSEEEKRSPLDPDGKDSESDKDPADSGGRDTDPVEEAGEFATGIHINRLEANQGVAVDLTRNGNLVAPSDRNAGLVNRRTTLVRAFWSLDADWRPRDIIARLSIRRPDGSVRTFDDALYVKGPPDAEVLDGAFHWLLEADEVLPGAGYLVELKETAHSDFGSASPELGARAPADGFADLGAVDAPMILKIALVPMVPPGGDAVAVLDRNREEVEEALVELSPVQEIQVSWAEPRPQSSEYLSTEQAWEDVYEAREDLGLGPDWYCHALLNPSGCCAMEEFEFTGAGQIAGPSPSDEDARKRSAIVMVELDVGSSALSIVHELGHNLGLSHAPCGGVDDPDGSYPYEGGAIGTQGFGILTGELHSGDEDVEHPYYDVMSYCWPLWYSDYHFEKVRERIQIVSSW